jgi:hypothetical protein
MTERQVEGDMDQQRGEKYRSLSTGVRKIHFHPCKAFDRAAFARETSEQISRVERKLWYANPIGFACSLGLRIFYGQSRTCL